MNNVHSTKSLYIKTYGCQMNVYDSSRMKDILAPLGYKITTDIEDADLIVLNTCHIREKAAEKVFSELGRIKPLKTARANSQQPLLIAVAGCVAQAEGKALIQRAPFVDIVIGPQATHKLPELIALAHRSNNSVLNTEFPIESKFDYLPLPKSDGPSAFLSIQEGCDKFCTFCVVPYTRGAEYSRPVEAILNEAKELISNNVREITLLGQNVNAYHGINETNNKKASLASLIRDLAEIEGLDRIRYITSHPRDMEPALIKAHGDIEKLMPYLHLPVQSGSNRILKKMNRGHSADKYRQIIDELRKEREDIALSSDFIVGFPGETDQDFTDTMQLVEEVSFAQAFSFKYSSRPGTPAADYPNQVPEDVKSARLAALQSLLNQQQNDFNQKCVGRAMPILISGKGRHAGQIMGRSPYLQPVHMEANNNSMGKIINAKITHAIANSLSAQTIP